MDLFSGVGGFALAAHWAGFQTVAFSEIDPYCTRILEKNFPGTPNLGDIRTADFSPYAGRVHLLTGGVPCQPASVAGKRKGREDERWLWPDFLAVLRTVRPAWLLAENVPGFVNLPGHGLDWFLGELEREGYQHLPLILGAGDIGAAHRRKRIWIVARYTGGSALADPGSIGRGRRSNGNASGLCGKIQTPGPRTRGVVLDNSAQRQNHQREPASMAEAQGRRQGEHAALGDAGTA